ncbi:MAG: hypothetical protein U1C74_16810 [Phenylobacterium sp.]|nr:hypothetical protein [Phenylobacterium sp.]
MTRETAKRITRILILVTCALWLGWDIYAYHTAGSKATISRVVADWVCEYWPAFAAFFFTLGHLTWPQRRKA